MITDKPKNQYDYDDGDIPPIDLPQDRVPRAGESNIEPLPESTRPRKDGPGGE